MMQSMFRRSSFTLGFFVMPMVVVFLSAAGVFGTQSAQAADVDFPGVVQGVVETASGQALPGAYVKLFNAEKRVTFMVISQERGRYTANNLPPGKYTVQGIGNGYQSKFLPVEVTAAKPATANVPLTEKQGQPVPNGWPGTPGTIGGNEVWYKMPQPKLPDGPGKEVVQTKCTQCHELFRITLQRFGKPKWEEKVGEMREYIHADAKKYRDLTDQEEELAVEYLAKNYTGEAGTANAKFDPNGRLSRYALKGDGAKYISMDFDIPVPDMEPHDVTVDRRGIAWVNYRTGCCLGRFDPKTYTFTEIRPPDGAFPTRMSSPAQGLDDSIWMADGGPNRRWFRVDTKTAEFTVFQAPESVPGLIGGNTMRVAPDGKMVWSTNAHRIIGLTVATKQFVAYDIPSWVKTHKNPNGYGMAIAGDGTIWFAERDAYLIGHLDPATGKIEEFKTPGDFDVPRRMSADWDGNVYVGLHETGKLVKIDYKTSKQTVLYPPTEKSGPYGVTMDPGKKILWFSEQTSDKIARYDPQTGKFTEFALPIIESDVRRIEVDPTNPNRIWWSGDTSNHLGYIELLP